MATNHDVNTFDYERFRRVVLSHAEQAIIDYVTDDGELQDMDELPTTQADVWAMGLVRELLSMHLVGQLPAPWITFGED